MQNKFCGLVLPIIFMTHQIHYLWQDSKYARPVVVVEPKNKGRISYLGAVSAYKAAWVIIQPCETTTSKPKSLLFLYTSLHNKTKNNANNL